MSSVLQAPSLDDGARFGAVFKIIMQSDRDFLRVRSVINIVGSPLSPEPDIELVLVKRSANDPLRPSKYCTIIPIFRQRGGLQINYFSML